MIIMYGSGLDFSNVGIASVCDLTEWHLFVTSLSAGFQYRHQECLRYHTLSIEQVRVLDEIRPPQSYPKGEPLKRRR